MTDWLAWEENLKCAGDNIDEAVDKLVSEVLSAPPDPAAAPALSSPPEFPKRDRLKFRLLVGHDASNGRLYLFRVRRCTVSGKVQFRHFVSEIRRVTEQEIELLKVIFRCKMKFERIGGQAGQTARVFVRTTPEACKNQQQPRCIDFHPALR